MVITDIQEEQLIQTMGLNMWSAISYRCYAFLVEHMDREVIRTGMWAIRRFCESQTIIAACINQQLGAMRGKDPECIPGFMLD